MLTEFVLPDLDKSSGRESKIAAARAVDYNETVVKPYQSYLGDGYNSAI
jgi:hypothetical protein